MSEPEDPPRQLVRELAGLARVELSEAEAEGFGGQLAAILRYLDALSLVDVEGVPEYLTADRPGSGLAADSPGPPPDVEAALAAIPRRHGRSVVVAKFKED